MNNNTFFINAFSNESFKGNPAGVYFLDKELEDSKLQKIAKEFKHPETSFLKEVSEDTFFIRWFSPKCEVPFCGHATLAAAKGVFHKFKNLHQIHFKSFYGNITAFREGELINLEFPMDYKEPHQLKDVEFLQKYMGIKKYKNIFIGRSTRKLIFHLNSVEEVLEVKPNFEKLLEYSSDNFNGIAITTESPEEGIDFITRCFNPWVGIQEDFVTGSVHTLLGSYYSELLKKNTLVACQKSAREGKLFLEIKDKERINIKGEGFIFLEGYIPI